VYDNIPSLFIPSFLINCCYFDDDQVSTINQTFHFHALYLRNHQHASSAFWVSTPEEEVILVIAFPSRDYFHQVARQSRDMVLWLDRKDSNMRRFPFLDGGKKIPGSKRCIFLLKSLLSSKDSPNYFPPSHVGSKLGYQVGAKFKTTTCVT
jgi:hypothetical protein